MVLKLTYISRVPDISLFAIDHLSLRRTRICRRAYIIMQAPSYVSLLVLQKQNPELDCPTCTFSNTERYIRLQCTILER